MTHLVNDQCINCKHTTCVTVCPVDCFYEGENMLVINPDECIDCAVSIPECPENAIYQSDDKDDAWYQHNEYFSKIWPVITKEKNPMPEYEKYSGIENKTNMFSKNPGK